MSDLQDDIIQDDVMADVRLAMGQEPEETIDETPEEKTERVRDDEGKFAKKEPQVEGELDKVEGEVEQVVPKARIEPPVSYTAAVKAEWDKLPESVQQELAKREGDIHRMMTAQDGDLRVGKEFKEVLTPYAPMFQHMGVAPKELVSDLMHKMHILNTGDAQTKTQLIHRIAQQFGVDLNGPQPEANPQLEALQRQIQQLSQVANPEVIEKRLQDRMLADKVNSEVEAFKANPQNVHFEQVKTIMGSLISSGAAKDLQDAYDQACYANPNIRSTMLQAQAAQEAQKRKLENEAKRKAGASVNGSPSAASPTTKAPTSNSVDDDVRAAMRELSGAI